MVRFAGWLAGWPWLVGWVAGWLVGWFVGWLTGWLVGCGGLVGWLAVLLVLRDSVLLLSQWGSTRFPDLVEFGNSVRKLFH